MATIEARHDGTAWRLYVNGIETGDTYESAEDTLAPYTYDVWIRTENGEGEHVGQIIASDDDAAVEAMLRRQERQVLPALRSARYCLSDPNGDSLRPPGQ
jgi:hypothetical protein